MVKIFESLSKVITIAKENLDKIRKLISVHRSYLTIREKLLKALYEIEDRKSFKKWIKTEFKWFYTYNVLSPHDIYDVLKQFDDKLSKLENEFNVSENQYDEANNIFKRELLKYYKKENISIYQQYILESQYGRKLDINAYRKELRESISKDGVTIDLDFFDIDDDDFLKEFPMYLECYDTVEVFHIDVEEAIGCIMKFLHDDKKNGRPYFLIKTKKLWDKLRDNNDNPGAIYLAGFEDGDISYIPNSKCILFTDSNENQGQKNLLVLRRRKIETIRKSLVACGCKEEISYTVMRDTNGLFSAIKSLYYKGSLFYFQKLKEMNENPKTIKALLLFSEWDSGTKDVSFINQVIGMESKEFMDQIEKIRLCFDGQTILLKKDSLYRVANIFNIWKEFGYFISEEEFSAFCYAMISIVVESLSTPLIVLQPKRKEYVSKHFIEGTLSRIAYILVQCRPDWQVIGNDMVRKLLFRCLNDGKQLIQVLNHYGVYLVDIAPNEFIRFVGEHEHVISKIESENPIIENPYGMNFSFFGTLIYRLDYALRLSTEQVDIMFNLLLKMTKWESFQMNQNTWMDEISMILGVEGYFYGLSSSKKIAYMKRIGKDCPSIFYDVLSNTLRFRRYSETNVLYRIPKYQLLKNDDEHDNDKSNLIESYFSILLEQADSMDKKIQIMEYFRLSVLDLMKTCHSIQDCIYAMENDDEKFSAECKIRNFVFDIRRYERAWYLNKQDILDILITIVSGITYQNPLMKYLYLLVYDFSIFPLEHPTLFKPGSFIDMEEVKKEIKLGLSKLKNGKMSFVDLLDLYFDYATRNKLEINEDLLSILSLYSMDFDEKIYVLLLQKDTKRRAVMYACNCIKDIKERKKILYQTNDEEAKALFFVQMYQQIPNLFSEIEKKDEICKEFFWKNYYFPIDSSDAVFAFNSFPKVGCGRDQAELVFKYYDVIGIDKAVTYLYLHRNEIGGICIYEMGDFLIKIRGRLENDVDMLKKLVELEIKFSDPDSNLFYIGIVFLKSPYDYFEFLNTKKENSASTLLFLERVHFCPGECSFASIDICAFDEWKNAFYQLCLKQKRLDLFNFFAKLLANSQVNEDGYPLTETVREYISSENFNTCMETSFEAAEMNKNIMVNMANYDEVISLANRYKNIGNHFKERGYYKLNRIYNDIGDIYFKEVEECRSRKENE